MLAYRDYLRSDLIVYEEPLFNFAIKTEDELVKMLFQGDLDACAGYYETNGTGIVLRSDTNNPFRIGRLKGNMPFFEGGEISRNLIVHLFPTADLKTIKQLRQMKGIAAQKVAESSQRAGEDLDSRLQTFR